MVPCCHRRRVPRPPTPPSSSISSQDAADLDRIQWLEDIRDRGEGPWHDIPAYHGNNPYHPVQAIEFNDSQTNIRRWSSLLHGLRALRRLQTIYHNTGKHLQVLGKAAQELSKLHHLGILRNRTLEPDIPAEIVD